MTSKHETSDADHLIEIACDIEEAHNSAAGAVGVLLREIAERLRDAPTMEMLRAARQGGGNAVRDQIRGLVLADRSPVTRLALILANVGMGSIPKDDPALQLIVPEGTHCLCGNTATRYLTLTDGSANMSPFCDYCSPDKKITVKAYCACGCGLPEGYHN